MKYIQFVPKEGFNLYGATVRKEAELFKKYKGKGDNPRIPDGFEASFRPLTASSRNSRSTAVR